MPQFALSYEKAILSDPNIADPQSIIQILLSNNAYQIDSRVGGTIVFCANSDFSFWFNCFSQLRKDFNYQLFELKDTAEQIPNSWHSIGHQDFFLKEVERIKNATP